MIWRDTTSRTASLVLAALFAVAIAAAYRELFFVYRLGHGYGWDLPPVCNALLAIAAGKDPYPVANIKGLLPLPYPIIAIYPFKALCPLLDTWSKAYAIVYLLILIGSCAALAHLLWRNAAETALVALVSISAFWAFRWLGGTGNIAVLEVPFAVLAILAVRRQHYALAGAAIGFMAILKIIPLIGALAFLILPIAWAHRIRAAATAIAVFVAVHLVNAVISGPYFSNYLNVVFGRMPDQHSPFVEAGGLGNPNGIDLAFAIFAALGVTKVSLVASAIGLAGLAMGAAMAMLSYHSAKTDAYATARVFALAFLVCMLAVMRLKPYAYAALVPFAIAALAIPNVRLRFAGYVVLMLAAAFWQSKMLMPIELAREYYQFIALATFVAMAFAMQLYVAAHPRSPPET